MRGEKKKLLISLLSVFMVCLIASTATTTVTAADYWGTLKAGDEMTWKDYVDTSRNPEFKILEVSGDTIKIEVTQYGITSTKIVDPDKYPTGLGLWLVAKGELSGPTSTYEFEGTNYKAYVEKNEFADGSFSELLWDFNTGILFEARDTDADGQVTVAAKLISCTADLAEASGGGGCLGTILIALSSVTAIVSYGLMHNRKKKIN